MYRYFFYFFDAKRQTNKLPFNVTFERHPKREMLANTYRTELARNHRVYVKMKAVFC